MIHYKPVQIPINAPGLAEIISDVVIRYHDLPGSETETQSSLSSSGPPGTIFELDCDYHPHASYKEDLDPHSKSS